MSKLAIALYKNFSWDKTPEFICLDIIMRVERSSHHKLLSTCKAMGPHMSMIVQFAATVDHLAKDLHCTYNVHTVSSHKTQPNLLAPD